MGMLPAGKGLDDFVRSKRACDTLATATLACKQWLELGSTPALRVEADPDHACALGFASSVRSWTLLEQSDSPHFDASAAKDVISHMNDTLNESASRTGSSGESMDSNGVLIVGSPLGVVGETWPLVRP